MIEAKFDSKEYSRFAQYYVENVDNLKELTNQVEELLSEGKEVPTALENEIFRHKVIVNILTQAGEERYNKAAQVLYQDGWHFWFIEDKEIRERDYGLKL